MPEMATVAAHISYHDALSDVAMGASTVATSFLPRIRFTRPIIQDLSA